MDLRPYITPGQLKTGIDLIKSGHLFYQPFILNDNLEIGEAQNFCDSYKNVNHIHDLNVFSNGFDFGERKLAVDKVYFNARNSEYRQFYHFIADNILKYTGKEYKDLSFAEIGCNTGLMLFELARRGARHCVGYDWNDMRPVFNWLNDILETDVKFNQGIWDNLYHNFSSEIPEVDVMINTIYTNHQFDPLQFLAYICDRSKVGVYLWILVSSAKNCSVEYPEIPPHKILENDLPFPLNFNNAVSVSEKMLYTTLKTLGFANVTEINPRDAVQNPIWEKFIGGFRMFYAERTADIKSAYWKKY